jgi:hypothetical protein
MIRKLQGYQPSSGARSVVSRENGTTDRSVQRMGLLCLTDERSQRHLATCEVVSLRCLNSPFVTLCGHCGVDLRTQPLPS